MKIIEFRAERFKRLSAKELYDRRTLVNRELKALEGELSNMTTPAEGVPEKEISLTDYVNQINTAIEQRNMIRAFFEKLREKKRKAADLEARITAQIKELEALSEEIEKDDKASKTLIEPDVDAMREKMGKIEATNAAVREKMRYLETKAKAERKAEMSESITNKTADVATQRKLNAVDDMYEALCVVKQSSLCESCGNDNCDECIIDKALRKARGEAE